MRWIEEWWIPKVFYQSIRWYQGLRFCLEASNHWSPKNMFQSQPWTGKAHIKAAMVLKWLWKRQKDTGLSLASFEPQISPQLKNSCPTQELTQGLTTNFSFTLYLLLSISLSLSTHYHKCMHWFLNVHFGKYWLAKNKNKIMYNISNICANGYSRILIAIHVELTGRLVVQKLFQFKIVLLW